MNEYIDEFRKYILIKADELKKIDAQNASGKPAPDKWSRKEILGHLIDSASNNHKRFVEAALKDDLIFSGYAHDDWVRIQNYQQLPWDDIIELWRYLNLHIAQVMNYIPAERRNRVVTKHNLHQISWQEVPEEEPTSLDYLMRDYIGHLKHHMNQIFA